SLGVRACGDGEPDTQWAVGPAPWPLTRLSAGWDVLGQGAQSEKGSDFVGGRCGRSGRQLGSCRDAGGSQTPVGVRCPRGDALCIVTLFGPEADLRVGC